MSIRTPTVERPATREEGIAPAVEAVEDRARPLSTEAVDRLVGSLSDRGLVLLGEASHGTSEFYRRRSELTAGLVRRGNVDFVAVEGDWTDCSAVSHFVKGRGERADARSVLDAFDRWPTWLWANWEVLEFAEWLRSYNEGRPEADRVGFYGMDVYSLFESMRAVVDYLEDVDPEAAERARAAYACFEPYGDDARQYARSTRLAPQDCEDEVVSVLAEFRRDAEPGRGGDRPGDGSPDDRFAAEQNALVARNAESYYRAMVQGGAESWNVRDRHMAETLERLREHHGGDGGGDPGRGIVWAHNTHVGDARATDMARRGEVNVGQLVREAHGDAVALVGFGTHRGSVVAGEAWDAPMERMDVPEAREGSYEDVVHRAGVGDVLLDFDLDFDDDGGALAEPRGHRAIGVVYHPARELGNYVPTVLPDRYDAFVHLDETRALHPLQGAIEGRADEPPDTYPWGCDGGPSDAPDGPRSAGPSAPASAITDRHAMAGPPVMSAAGLAGRGVPMSRRHRETPTRRHGADSDAVRSPARRSSGDRGSPDRRYGGRYGDRSTTAHEAAGEEHGRDTGGRMPKRAHGGRRATPNHRSRGNPRVGSQRGEDSVQGVSGRVGRQFGDLHGPRPTESESAGYHGEEQFAGAAGRDSRDRRYGSRRGHGSQRREDERTRR